ncbi:MAG: outer membrane protein [Alphaproteobacteria bacterium]
MNLALIFLLFLYNVAPVNSKESVSAEFIKNGTSFYLGGKFGINSLGGRLNYEIIEQTHANPDTIGQSNVQKRSSVAGAFLGILYRPQSCCILGAEFFYNHTNIDNSVHITRQAGANVAYSISQRFKESMGMNIRLGYVLTHNYLIYGGLGLSAHSVQYRATVIDTDHPREDGMQITKRYIGTSFKLGFETPISQSYTLGVEADYTIFPKKRYSNLLISDPINCREFVNSRFSNRIWSVGMRLVRYF